MASRASVGRHLKLHGACTTIDVSRWENGRMLLRWTWLELELELELEGRRQSAKLFIT